MFRCALRRNPLSSLATDCISAMADGLNSNLYKYFLTLLWGDGKSTNIKESNTNIDSDWNYFCSVILQMGRKPTPGAQQNLDVGTNSSWEFLLNSKFHKNYCKISFEAFSGTKLRVHRSDFSSSGVDSAQGIQDPFLSELCLATLDSLHAVYENLKLDNLRKR